VVLEITSPTKPPLSTFFSLWFDRVVPLLGRFDEAYTYLPSSVKRFPAPPALAEALVRAGCSRVGWVLTAGGIIAIHHGVKSPGGDSSASSTSAGEGRVAG
jgi:demethylmenaquinone methyltransferase/2-methoxy-6-polyprenyl-1,4-benzoquinol methylase